MSDAVHLMNALQKSTSANNLERVKDALHIVWVPTLLTSVTTAIGFISLIWINTEPVQTLGILASIGVLIAFTLTFTLGLLIASITTFSNQRKIIEVPEAWLITLTKRRTLIGVSAIVLMILITPGLAQLKIDAYLLDDLPKSNSVRQDFEFVDQKLGGSKPYEIRLEVADSALSIWDREVMDQIVVIEDYLLNEYPIVKAQSPATIIKYLHMVNNGGLNQNYLYPEEALM